MRMHIMIIFAFLMTSSTVFAEKPLSPQNQKILEFVGEPVIHSPENPAYSPETLLAEFKAACEKSQIGVSAVYVDTSEFPFLIYGAWGAWEGMYKTDVDLGSVLSAYKPEIYSYEGSVGGQTCFAVNIIPKKAYPDELRSRINRRMLIRLSVLFNSLLNEN